MHAHVLQHVPFEGAGLIRSRLEQHGFTLHYHHLFDGQPLPSADNIDFLVIMGGPMSVNDEQQYPWLKAEKSFIRDFIATGKPLLGVCLGAQLIASSLGATVSTNRFKEVGWFPVHGSAQKEGVFSIPETITVLHWHGDTFELPEKATLLARSEACRNQAFQIGRRVIGLQFHPEVDLNCISHIIEHCDDASEDGPYIQSADRILSESDDHIENCKVLLDQLIAYMLAD